MVQKHVQLGITKEQRFRFASLMSLAADDAGMPEDPEFRSALVAYLEWGTRLAFDNSQANAVVIQHAPVPRWVGGKRPRIAPDRACA
jgi:hemoglobin